MSPYSKKLQSKTKRADLKLTVIPIVFLFLKIWGTILGVLYIYLRKDERPKFSATLTNAILILVTVSPQVGGMASLPLLGGGVTVLKGGREEDKWLAWSG